MATPSRRREFNTVSPFETRNGGPDWDLAEFRSIYENGLLGLYSVDIGRRVREIVPTLADSLEPLYRQVLESGECVLDVKIQWAQPVEPTQLNDKISSYYPIEAEDGTVIGVSAVVGDSTDQVRIERAPLERQERYHPLFEKANAGRRASILANRFFPVRKRGLSRRTGSFGS